MRAQLLDRQLLVEDRLDRGEDARPRQDAARDGLPQRLVDRRAKRLHGRDTADERAIGVLRRIKRSLGLRLLAVPPARRRLPIGGEVPPDVHVRVDAARHERSVAKVDVDVLRMLVDGNNLPAVNDDGGVAEQMPAAVDEPRSPNDEGGKQKTMHTLKCKALSAASRSLLAWRSTPGQQARARAEHPSPSGSDFRTPPRPPQPLLPRFVGRNAPERA